VGSGIEITIAGRALGAPSLHFRIRALNHLN
jgi:hypothetical protein